MVKIKTKLCLNQWEIVERDGEKEFSCDVLVVHQGELSHIHKAELRVLDLTEQQKQNAFKLMMRMQYLWG